MQEGPESRARLVVLTGASSGIGAATALRLASPSTHLVLVARRRAALEGVAMEVERRGGAASVLPLDLRDHDATQTSAVALLEAHGIPDVVVANAGHSIARPVLECVDRFDSYERTIAVNYLGAVAFAQPFLAAMAARRHGQVVGVTTVNARMPVPGWAPYCASKAAFDTWLRCAEPELRRYGVAVSIVAFPLVRTPMAEPTYGASPPLAMSADAAAAWVEKAIRTRRAWVGPWWGRPAEIATAAAPTLAARLTARVSLRRRRAERLAPDPLDPLDPLGGRGAP